VIDVLRWATVYMSALTVLIGTPQWPRWWRTYPPEIVQGRLALALMNVAVGYGTWEALRDGLPGGSRNVLCAVGVLWCLYAVAWQPVLTLIHHLPRRHHRAE
jgi:hypothetical protein